MEKIPCIKKQNPPKDHHYVHESYQKRFLSEAGQMFVLTKEYKFQVKPKKPGQICYVSNLNTLKIKNQSFVEIEKYYGQIEGGIARLFEEIEDYECKGLFGEAFKDKYGQLLLKFFIAKMFWRNPNQSDLAGEYIDNILRLYDSADNKAKKLIKYDRSLIKFLYRHKEKDWSRKVIQFILLPILTFKIFDTKKSIRSYVSPGKNFITCDNPVIMTDSIEKLFSFERFLFPLDKVRVIANADIELEKFNIDLINLKVALNAKKWAMGSNKEYLEVLGKGLRAEPCKLNT